MEVARGIVEVAIGEQMDGSPLPVPEPDTRNPHAVALGSMGGQKGGKARAKEADSGETKGHCEARRAFQMGLDISDKQFTQS